MRHQISIAILLVGCGGSDFSSAPTSPNTEAGSDAGSEVDAAFDADGGQPDAEPETGLDAEPEAALEAGPETGSDAAPEVGLDATPDIVEAGPDAEPDAEPEAGPDAEVEAGIDASPDAEPEAGLDAAPDAEAGLDASPEADADAGCVNDTYRCDGQVPQECTGGEWIDRGGPCVDTCEAWPGGSWCDSPFGRFEGPIVETVPYDDDYGIKYMKDTTTDLFWRYTPVVYMNGPTADDTPKTYVTGTQEEARNFCWEATAMGAEGSWAPPTADQFKTVLSQLYPSMNKELVDYSIFKLGAAPQPSPNCVWTLDMTGPGIYTAFWGPDAREVPDTPSSTVCSIWCVRQ